MRWLGLLLVLTAPALADSLVATRTIKAKTVIAAEDVALVAAAIPGSVASPEEAVGKEARVTLYAGRPIKAADLGSPALVDRNQKVTLLFQTAGLTIRVDGRALDRGGEGDPIRVMNLASRQTVTGLVAADGTIRVGSSQGMNE
ncbi:flagellar basal body P-ring formation chaperone FlgA [Rhodobacter sp. KR11]|uniref:flagellar basal body P-ring formation chaperone FlgA n=1 Tax=Rhodobacter sp. KR11 TaxID=2974588 RepID=UPI0022214F0F|nr:flagellar basal body P-ring formation chaperone FlgA [Rhodobacter sp. KR11]MCW1919184.1 flagellar basal body P-ring formation chaperone FlgA [Rhodobacter sp. KR11]